MRRLILDIPESEYNDVLQYVTQKGGKVKSETKPAGKAIKAAKELANIVKPTKKDSLASMRNELLAEAKILDESVKPNKITM
jgi:hypothetical protein